MNLNMKDEHELYLTNGEHLINKRKTPSYYMKFF